MDFSKISKRQKQIIINSQLAEIYIYPDWQWVLEQLNINPLKTDLSDIISQAKHFKTGGESEEHKRFKEYIAKNPSAIGLDKSTPKGLMEYLLPSSDEVDILFQKGSLLIGVEVKSIISNKADILRGLFQCVKYKSLIEAEQCINSTYADCRIILALEGPFPIELFAAKNILGIDVVDNIQIQ